MQYKIEWFVDAVGHPRPKRIVRRRRRNCGSGRELLPQSCSWATLPEAPCELEWTGFEGQELRHWAGPREQKLPQCGRILASGLQLGNLAQSPVWATMSWE